MSDFQRFEAMILRVVSYGERDLIVTLFGIGVGKITVFAPAARRSVKRFPGGLEPFRRYRIMLRTQGRRGMPILSESEILEDLPLVGDLSQMACASCAIELTRALIPDNEPEDRLYLHLWKVLICIAGLKGSDHEIMELTLRWFEVQALNILGFAPQFDRCIRTQKPLAEIADPGFSIPSGGVISMDASERRDEAFVPPRRLLLGMHRLQSETDLLALLRRASELRQTRDDSGLPVFVDDAGELIQRLLRPIIKAPLKSYDFFKKMMILEMP